MSVNLFVKLLGLHLLYELQFCKKLKMKADSHNSIFLFQTDNTFRWSFGGFQGARGSNDGKEWYVENIFEELDVPGEWFLDKTSMKLYYYPNRTLPSKVRFV